MPKTVTPSLFDTPRPGSNLPEFTVTDLSKQLKKTVEDAFGLVRVRGEIGDCKHHSNGHIYITLKDEGAILASVVWRGSVNKLGLRPEIGMDVVCTGRLTTYAGQSKYQMVIEGMALAGIGALLKLLEERKKKLAAEGLFDESRKQLLPFLPDVIGVVTSPTGAVIRDILHRLADRFPRRVLVWPVAVQGEGAAEQIATAIRGFNELAEGGPVPRPDLLIVARGGGSVEDLMPFNEEIVVRAAADSSIPLISAVGHETDTTLIDFASDIRAPTPTAAAEMAVPVRADLLAQVAEEGIRLNKSMRRQLVEQQDKLAMLGRALGDPTRALEPLMQKLDERVERLQLSWHTFLDRRAARVAEFGGKLRHPRDVIRLAAERLLGFDHKMQGAWRSLIERRASRVAEQGSKLRHPRDILRFAAEKLLGFDHKMQAAWRENFLRKQHRLEKIADGLQHLSPRAVLQRGYALVQNADGRVIANRGDAKSGEALSVEFHDGKIGVVVK